MNHPKTKGIVTFYSQDNNTENKILSDTVKWMHDTIWEMIREQKGYTDQSAAQIINSLQDDKSTHTDH